MSSSYCPAGMSYSAVTEEIDVGLQGLPASFDLKSLFPGDRLLRFHPNWFISGFQQNGTSIKATIKDYVTEEEFPLSGDIIFNRGDDEMLYIQLTESLDVGISFFNRNNKLTVQISSQKGDIDPNDPILLWIRAIKEYIRIYLKNTPATLFFRLLMNKMVLKMDPSQRKICLMMAKITAVELLVILLIVIAYVFFLS
jgi:hypothetical protein